MGRVAPSQRTLATVGGTALDSGLVNLPMAIAATRNMLLHQSPRGFPVRMSFLFLQAVQLLP